MKARRLLAESASFFFKLADELAKDNRKGERTADIRAMREFANECLCEAERLGIMNKPQGAKL